MFELAAGGAGPARLAATAFAVEASRPAGLPSARGRRMASGRGGRPLAREIGYTGHGSLLDVDVGWLPTLHQEGSFLATSVKKGQSRTEIVHLIRRARVVDEADGIRGIEAHDAPAV